MSCFILRLIQRDRNERVILWTSDKGRNSIFFIRQKVGFLAVMRLMITSFLRLRLGRRLREIRSQICLLPKSFPPSAKWQHIKSTMTTNQGKGKVTGTVNSNEIKECKSIHTRLNTNNRIQHPNYSLVLASINTFLYRQQIGVLLHSKHFCTQNKYI